MLFHVQVDREASDRMQGQQNQVTLRQASKQRNIQCMKMKFYKV